MRKTPSVIGIGEVLWDMFPDGKMLGGAPANFAFHVCQLGVSGVVISAVGKDPLGSEISGLLQHLKIENYLTETSEETGTVGVHLLDGKPSYTIYEGVAWDNITLSNEAIECLRQADAICFGSLAQRNQVSKRSVWSALQLVPDQCLKVYDINLRQDYYSKEIIENSLRAADVFKLNDEELAVVSDLLSLRGSEEQLCRQIMDRYRLRVLALTKGTGGSTILSSREVSMLPTPVVEVADTVGAGDSFTAAITVGLLCKKPISDIHKLAVDISAFVCTQDGATPTLSEELKELVTEILNS